MEAGRTVLSERVGFFPWSPEIALEAQAISSSDDESGTHPDSLRSQLKAVFKEAARRANPIAAPDDPHVRDEETSLDAIRLAHERLQEKNQRNQRNQRRDGLPLASGDSTRMGSARISGDKKETGGERDRQFRCLICGCVFAKGRTLKMHEKAGRCA
jgi:hypothetical protein